MLGWSSVNGGTRLGIQLSASREDLMSLLKQILYGLGCVTDPSLCTPLCHVSPFKWPYVSPKPSFEYKFRFVKGI
jgi:hypothetical protein